MSRIESNALMRRLLKQHETLPLDAPFEVSSAEKFILCDPVYSHVMPALAVGPGRPLLTRETLISEFGGATFKGRTFVVKD